MPSTSPPSATRNLIVRLPDATVGEQVWSSPTESIVVHGDRTIGRGPWPMRRSQVVEATMSERAAYYDRVVSHLIVEGAPSDVVESARQLADDARMVAS